MNRHQLLLALVQVPCLLLSSQGSSFSSSQGTPLEQKPKQDNKNAQLQQNLTQQAGNFAYASRVDSSGCIILSCSSPALSSQGIDSPLWSHQFA